MERVSRVLTETDAGGEYEIETFDCARPKSVVVCVHGNGVRRWDGERFFYEVAENYPKRAFLLVDQNQPYEDGCKLNDLKIMVARVQRLIEKAAEDYPGGPIIVMGHSMGCGIITQLDLNKVSEVIFVAPASGDQHASLTKRYGKDILKGKVVTTSDGLTKYITKEYVDSVRGIVWEKEYEKFLERYRQPVYVYESGDEEIVGKDRFKHRDMPFTDYKIIPGATHNLHGEALRMLFGELDDLL